MTTPNDKDAPQVTPIFHLPRIHPTRGKTGDFWPLYPIAIVIMENHVGL